MEISNRLEIKGKTIIKELGLVKGNVVKSKIFYKDIFAGIRNFLGWEVIEYTKALEEARNTATERMIKDAERLNANAVLNVRYESNTTSRGTAEILAYGTAVIVE